MALDPPGVAREGGVGVVERARGVPLAMRAARAVRVRGVRGGIESDGAVVTRDRDGVLAAVVVRVTSLPAPPRLLARGGRLEHRGRFRGGRARDRAREGRRTAARANAAAATTPRDATPTRTRGAGCERDAAGAKAGASVDGSRDASPPAERRIAACHRGPRERRVCADGAISTASRVSTVVSHTRVFFRNARGRVVNFFVHPHISHARRRSPRLASGLRPSRLVATNARATLLVASDECVRAQFSSPRRSRAPRASVAPASSPVPLQASRPREKSNHVSSFLRDDDGPRHAPALPTVPPDPLGRPRVVPRPRAARSRPPRPHLRRRGYGARGERARGLFLPREPRAHARPGHHPVHGPDLRTTRHRVLALARRSPVPHHGTPAGPRRDVRPQRRPPRRRARLGARRVPRRRRSRNRRHPRIARSARRASRPRTRRRERRGEARAPPRDRSKPPRFFDPDRRGKPDVPGTFARRRRSRRRRRQRCSSSSREPRGDSDIDERTRRALGSSAAVRSSVDVHRVRRRRVRVQRGARQPSHLSASRRKSPSRRFQTEHDRRPRRRRSERPSSALRALRRFVARRSRRRRRDGVHLPLRARKPRQRVDDDVRARRRGSVGARRRRRPPRRRTFSRRSSASPRPCSRSRTA